MGRRAPRRGDHLSAGVGAPGPHVYHDVNSLAPAFRERVIAALEECNAAGLDAVGYETYRSAELQELYWHRGRDVKPPEHPVTNARSNLYSWHGYGLAIDVISKAEGWFNPAGSPELRGLPNTDPRVRAYVARGAKWFGDVAAIFRKHGCKCGLDWKKPDPPHMQWGRCKPTPSDRARELLREGGPERVWKEVGAAA